LVPVGIQAWGITACFLLLWGGWFLGGVLSFGVGRYLGRVVVERLVGTERFGRFERRVSRSTRFLHILLFQAMLPSEIPGYVLGSVRYRFVPFALALAIVELPYALGTIYIGESFLQQRGWLLIALAAGGALIIAVAYAIYRRRPRPLPSTRV
ncbi:MAG TPA: VTT domain-containing protein, partial [Gammaproteobacteria bacterium]|nr:VTT domain-containing protein [Gammaproteobacteria bacterium]